MVAWTKDMETSGTVRIEDVEKMSPLDVELIDV